MKRKMRYGSLAGASNRFPLSSASNMYLLIKTLRGNICGYGESKSATGILTTLCTASYQLDASSKNSLHRGRSKEEESQDKKSTSKEDPSG